MTHKDLSSEARDELEHFIDGLVRDLYQDGESLALFREAMINAFDRAAEDLDAQ